MDSQIKKVRLVVDVTLDCETVSEIETMRNLQLNHYRNVLRVPEKALDILRLAGLTTAESAQELQAQILENITEIESRLLHPDVIYDEEMHLYIETLNAK